MTVKLSYLASAFALLVVAFPPTALGAVLTASQPDRSARAELLATLGRLLISLLLAVLIRYGSAREKRFASFS